MSNKGQYSVTDSRVMMVTLFLFFLLSGLVDLQSFYCGYRLIPEGSQVKENPVVTLALYFANMGEKH